MKVLTFGSLFAGIGGFDLGFERAGMTCCWQVENHPIAMRILGKHWPNIRRHNDVCTFPVKPFSDWTVDVICGGFPCQDISNAGKKAGIEGERSGLWSEFARIIRTLRPRYVVVENVEALCGRGLGKVLGDLFTLGFDAEWSVVPACALGAPHPRKRLFIVAYTQSIGKGQRWREQFHKGSEEERDVCKWPGEPEPIRMVDGVPHRMDRNERLGNSLMPQIAELIGRRIHRAHVATHQ